MGYLNYLDEEEKKRRTRKRWRQVTTSHLLFNDKSMLSCNTRCRSSWFNSNNKVFASNKVVKEKKSINE